jgi:hypothetical protein
LWKCKLVQPLWKAVWGFLKKIVIELPYDPVILLLGIYPKECKTGYGRYTCMLMLIAALFIIAKLWKQSRCPTTDEWIMKLWCIYTQWSITQPQGIMTWLKLNRLTVSGATSQVEKLGPSCTASRDEVVQLLWKSAP